MTDCKTGGKNVFQTRLIIKLSTVPLQGRSQTFMPGGPSGRQWGQAKFSKYFNLVENHLKLVLKFVYKIRTKIYNLLRNFSLI